MNGVKKYQLPYTQQKEKNSTFTQFKANKNIGGAKNDKRKKTRNH